MCFKTTAGGLEWNQTSSLTEPVPREAEPIADTDFSFEIVLAFEW